MSGKKKAGRPDVPLSVTFEVVKPLRALTGEKPTVLSVGAEKKPSPPPRRQRPSRFKGTLTPLPEKK